VLASERTRDSGARRRVHASAPCGRVARR
jgi:hypothetical protein